MTVADDLVARMEAATQWPLDQPILRRVSLHQALREADDVRLRHAYGWKRNRSLVPDPLPAQIATAHADLLFGDEASITAANTSDQERLDDLVDAIDGPSEFHRAARIASSEGEVWWRAYTDREASDRPLLQWVSRLDVVPLWRGGRAVAVAFVSVLEDENDRVVRHIEIQAPGETLNLLYEGTRTALGKRMPLTAHVETVDLPDEWLHPPLMLAGRILNRPSDTGIKLGKSDYAGLEAMFMSLNEATTIASENARVAGKVRIFADSKYLDHRGNLPADEDVFVRDADGATLGDDKGGIAQAQYEFEAAALNEHIRYLIERIVTRAGLVPQWVGVMEQGQAESGTALRVRLLPATLSAQGKGRFWTDGLPRILGVLQMLDAMHQADGGFGRTWTSALEEPSVDLGDPIPADDTEEAQREALLITAGLSSRWTSIKTMRPDWGDEQVKEELARIAEEESARMSDAFTSDDDEQGKRADEEEVAA